MTAFARISLATAVAATMLSISIGLQGCIENPGTDHRLNRENHEYRAIATVRYAEESILELSVKHDSGAVSLRILGIAHERIDSASFLLQFGEASAYSESALYHKMSRLNVIVRIANLETGAVLDYGAISRDMDLTNTFPSANLIRFADGVPRGNPLGGVYSGNYSLIDTAGRRTMGTLKGIITVDGDYQFFMDTGLRYDGIQGYLKGGLDSTRRDGYLIAESFAPQYSPTTIPALFTLDSGILKGTFLPRGVVPWFDSIGCELHPVRFFGE